MTTASGVNSDPLYTRLMMMIFGASISETTMRPHPIVYWYSGCLRAPCACGLTRRRPGPRPRVGENIHRYPTSLTSLECHASELVYSDACPRPTPRQAAGGSSFYAAMDTNRNTTADVNPGPGVVRYRYRQARGGRAVLLHGGLLPFIAFAVFKRAGAE